MPTLQQYHCDRRQVGRMIKRQRRDIVACALLAARLPFSQAPRTKEQGAFISLLLQETDTDIKTPEHVIVKRAFNRLQERRFNAITRQVLKPALTQPRPHH